MFLLYCDIMVSLTDGYKDIHYYKSRYENQKRDLPDIVSIINFKDWCKYEKYMFSKNRKLPTVLKHMGSFKRLLKLYDHHNLKALDKKEIIDANCRIITSDFKQTTKIDMQLFLREYISSFSESKGWKAEIYDLVKLLPKPEPNNEIILSEKEFWIGYRKMPTKEMKSMTLVLFPTGMRITELYNIQAGKNEYVKKSIFRIELPPSIFGWHGVWIYTKGKRTKHIPNGNYKYFMTKFVKEFKSYEESFNYGVYIYNISYTLYLKSLHNSFSFVGHNIKIHPHIFRHTHAKLLFLKYPQKLVNKIMNWSPNSKMGYIYGQIGEKDVEKSL